MGEADPRARVIRFLSGAGRESFSVASASLAGWNAALIKHSRSAAILQAMNSSRPLTRTQHYLDRRWTALIVLCAAQFVVVLDASIVNVALPTIGKALHFSEANLPWVVNGYVIAFGGFLLLGGRAADLLGRRRVFMAGLLLVGVASLAAGFASNEGQLIAGRVAQGLGAAIVGPSALSIVTTLFRDGVERNKALGVWGAVAGS